MTRVLLIASLVFGGCATAQPHTLGTSAVFHVLETGPDAGRLERLSVLHLPSNATLTIEPVWFVGRLHDLRPDLRPQIVLRAILDDGGEIRWEPHDGSKMIAHRWNPQQRYKLALGGRAAGPFHVRNLARIEVLVADLDRLPAAGRAGASSLMTPSSESWASAEQAARTLGSDLELVGKIAIQVVGTADIGERFLHLAVIEAEPDPRDGGNDDAEARLGQSMRLMRTIRDGDPAVADLAGHPVARMSALTLRLKIAVVDHETRPPPGENQEEKRENDWDRFRWLHEAPPRRVSTAP
jgi:hypothetical protein